MIRPFGRACLTGVAAVILYFGAHSPSSATEPGPADSGTYFVNPTDRAAATAEAEAKRSLPTFWSKYDARAPGYSNFVLKVRLPADEPEAFEVIWARVVRQEPGAIVVKLANVPVAMSALHLGSEVVVQPDQIADWSYELNGKAYGHFITRVVMKDFEPNERAELEAYLAPTPLEPSVN